jgi:hypothetical protein
VSATLILLHGRGQEGKDPEALRRSWLAALGRGWGAVGSPDRVPSVLPYYGNLLHRITAELAAAGTRIELEDLADAAVPLHPELPAEVGDLERALLADLVANATAVARAAAGGEPPVPSEPTDLTLERIAAAGLALPPVPGAVSQERWDSALSWGVARGALVWLARWTPVDQEIIKAHLRDVAVYLTAGRERILAEVRRRLPADGPLVLVTHSLGTVVARDLLDDPALCERTLLWVTAGSPLGLEAVQRNLRTPGTVHPGVRQWLSCYDVNDIVALGHPLARTWGRPLDDVRVENGDASHSIERYLAHSAVAGRIAATVREAARVDVPGLTAR